MKNDDTSEKTSQSPWPLIISLVVIAGGVGCYFIFPGFEAFINESYEVLTSDDKKRISQWVKQFGIWGPVFIVVVMVLQMFLFIVPSVLLMVVSILAYGPWLGTLINLAAVAVASSFGWLIGKSLGKYTVHKLIGQKTRQRLEKVVNKYGVWAVIIFRLSPVLSNDAVSFVAGLMRMKYWKFMAATTAGIAPLAIFIAILGEEVEELMGGLIWVGALSLAVFIGYVIFERYKK